MIESVDLVLLYLVVWVVVVVAAAAGWSPVMTDTSHCGYASLLAVVLVVHSER